MRMNCHFMCCFVLLFFFLSSLISAGYIVLLFYWVFCTPVCFFIFLFCFLVNKNIFRDKLFYFKLKPNYEIFWQSDSDAVNSIDPFICSLYFISNGFKILNYPNILKSLFIKSDYLLMQKL